jgi:transposase
MPQATPFTDLTDDRLEDLRQRAATKREFQRVQCLFLRQHGGSSKDIAATLSMKAVGVRRVWSDYRKRGEEAIFVDRRGGRYNENMSEEEEKEFLAPFFENAKEGGILVVNEIKRTYEKKLRRSVPKSTVYEMLHRHGWRKVAPKPSHPQGDPVKREKFKTIFPPDRRTRKA